MRPPAAAAAAPYVVGQWVRGETFYGRSAVIEEILDGPRDGIWLLGTRRVGKTSLLKQLELLAAPGDRGYFPLFWDFQGAESLAELSRDFEDALLDVEGRLGELGIELEEVRGGDLFAALGRMRRRLRAKHRRLLLLCDEVEELIQLQAKDPSLLRKLRRALRAHAGIRVVLASSIRLWALAEQRDDTSPFLHAFLPPLYIRRLVADEARALIRQQHLPAASRPSFEPRTVEAIRRRCDDHPHLTQLVCSRRLELGDLDEACADVAADPMANHLFAVDFDTLSRVERRILLFLAERHPASSDTIRASLPLSHGALDDELRRLESLGLLRRDDQRRFRIANRFLHRWLRDHSREVAEPGVSPAGPARTLTEHLESAAREGGRTPEELLPQVYDQLRRVAGRYLQRERPGHTLQATALVHEAYLKLVDQTRVSWQGRTHFFAVGAKAMRRLLIDHARGRARAKRGGDFQRVTLNEALTPFAGPDLDFEQLLALDAALDKLRRLDPRRARIVELRFFSGLTIEEVAAHLRLSKRTVDTEWSRARKWLEQELAVGGEYAG